MDHSKNQMYSQRNNSFQKFHVYKCDTFKQHHRNMYILGQGGLFEMKNIHLVIFIHR